MPDEPKGIDRLQALLEAKAAADEGGDYGLDPLLIAAIVEAVVTAIRGCLAPSPGALKNPWNKPLLRLALRRQREYLALPLPRRAAVLEQVWALGQSSPDAALAELIREAEGK